MQQHQQHPSISVVLTSYKRPTLGMQLKCIADQTIPVKSEDIHVIYNSYDERSYPNDNRIKIYELNWNSKFHGRFAIALLCQTEYVLILDDDMFPRSRWVEQCLYSINNFKDGIYGGSGIVLRDQNKYIPHTKVGWNGEHYNYNQEVHLVGHSWFMKTEYLHALWMERPTNWNNGEDIALSYLARKHLGIKSFITPHSLDRMDVWSTNPQMSKEWGMDDNASYKLGNHYEDRNQLISYYSSSENTES